MLVFHFQNDVYCYRVRWCDSWVSHDALPDSWQHLVDNFWKKQTEQQITVQQDEANRFIHSLNTKFLPNFSTLLTTNVQPQQQNLISTNTPDSLVGPLQTQPALFSTTQQLVNLNPQQTTFTLTPASLRDNQLDISTVGEFQIPLFEQTSQTSKFVCILVKPFEKFLRLFQSFLHY